MKTTIARLALLACLPPIPSMAQITADEVVLEVNVLPGKGVGKFHQSNITVEQNKVIQAPFAGGDGNELEQVLTAADGALFLCGTLGTNPDDGLPFTPSSNTGPAFVARLSPDARHLTAILRLPPEFANARRIAIGLDGTLAVAGDGSKGEMAVAKLSPSLDSVLWTRPLPGKGVASVSIAPDGSVVVCPEQNPFVRRIAADGSKFVPFGNNEAFRIDGGNPEVVNAWWDGNGYPAAGYRRGVTYQRGGNAGVVALPDGTFVHFSCHFLHHPGGGPDFDPMLLRFDADGRILWCTNLLDGLPAESDHKSPVMSHDPHTGDLLIAGVQHGHFRHNYMHTQGAYMNPHPFLTGNIMIGWLARIDPATGKPKAASFFFPVQPGPMVGGKKQANSLFPDGIAADAHGNIYLTGRSAYGFETTLHAYQSEGQSGAFIAAFTPDLTRLIYSSLILAPGFKILPRSIAVAPGGPVTIGNFEKKDPGSAVFQGTNPDVTNYLRTQADGLKGGFLNYTPSSGWMN